MDDLRSKFGLEIFLLESGIPFEWIPESEFGKFEPLMESSKVFEIRQMGKSKQIYLINVQTGDTWLYDFDGSWKALKKERNPYLSR